MKKKSLPAMKIKYMHVQPKTRKETEEVQMRLDRAYDILFDAVDAANTRL